MKRYLLSSVFTFMIASATFAQVKQIESNDFSKANSEAYRLMSGVSKRVVTKTENIENGAVINSVENISENILPNRSRYVRTENKGGVETVSETIVIDDTIYRRTDKEPWTTQKIGGGIGSGNGTGGFSSCTQYTEESDFANGQSARKLRRLEIKNSEKGLAFDDSLVWYNLQGQFLRTETVRGLLEPRSETYRSTVNYEYNPNIKIEAPIK
ncbi:MAG: hypothetical protein H7Z37_01045 [Pyrinomonadaceae bacterium]|nr:hypothetical protein [Pyrinomonadaceae bacterium]